jgi:hypothetical protein
MELPCKLCGSGGGTPNIFVDPFAQGDWRNAERLLNIAYRRTPLNPTADLWDC